MRAKKEEEVDEVPQVIKADDGAVCHISETDSAEGGPRWNVTYDLHHPPPCARADRSIAARACGLPLSIQYPSRHQHKISEAVRGRGRAQSVPVTPLEPHVSRGGAEYWCGAGMQGPVSREPTTARRVCTTLQTKKTEMVWDGRERRKEVMYTERGDEE